MKILAIETSCDDTGIAILEVSKTGGFKVLANIVSSQTEVHKQYGGVFPAMAKREHQKNLVPTFVKAIEEAKLLEEKSKEISKDQQKILYEIFAREHELKESIVPFLKKYSKPDVDLIAVTNGPGLEPCLWVGVNFAKALAYFWDIPVVDVNHIKAHIFVNVLGEEKIEELKAKDLPALALVVSGGHTQIVLIKKLGQYEILGETRDDAAGECFDKCAKILGLGYPGGPIISALAQESKPGIQKLPRPMINSKDYDFSFSGLKTAVLYADREVKNKTDEYKKQMAAEVQQAIIDVLVKKTIKAVKDFKAKTLILGGGVTANKELRTQMQKKLAESLPEAKFLVPSPSLSTDNALMIAITGYFRRAKKIAWQKLQADSNLRISK